MLYSFAPFGEEIEEHSPSFSFLSLSLVGTGTLYTKFVIKSSIFWKKSEKSFEKVL
jgi:hypothetical protein